MKRCSADGGTGGGCLLPYSDLGAAESEAKVKGNYAFILTGNHEAILLTIEFV